MTLTREEVLARAHDSRYSLSGDGAAPVDDLRRDVFDRTTSQALNRVDSLHTRTRISDEAAQLLQSLVRCDRSAQTAAFVAAAADDTYERAFARVVARGADMARLEMPERERQALERVNLAASALNVGTGSGGLGLVIPVVIDPTVIATSAGAINPWRTIARTATISGTVWRGLTSDGVEATYEAELTEVGDQTPTFATPEAHTEKAQAWVEFSIEAGQDWPDLVDELGRMFQRAKDELEAEKFTNGLGHVSNEPEGIIAALPPDALIETSSGDATINTADVYELKAELPTGFQANASWLGHGATFDVVRQMTGPGSDEQPVFEDIGPTILRRPAHELSAMPSPVYGAFGDGDRILALGDWQSAAIVVDRIGATVELVPLVLTANGRPRGSRGAYMFWRSTSKLLVPEAVRCIRFAGSNPG